MTVLLSAIAATGYLNMVMMLYLFIAGAFLNPKGKHGMQRTKVGLMRAPNLIRTAH